MFLEKYAQIGSVRQACEAAGISHMTHYRKMRTDAGYRAAFEEAEELVGQELEDMAVERARDGDNQMLTVLLKRFRPELYRERISTDTTITVNLVDRMTAANERLLTLRRAQVAGSPSEPGEPDDSDNS